MNTNERERQMIRELSDAEFNARGLARSRYHDWLFHEGKPRPANNQFDEGWSAARSFYLADAAARMREACVEKLNQASYYHDSRCLCVTSVHGPCDCGAKARFDKLMSDLQSLTLDGVEQKDEL